MHVPAFLVEWYTIRKIYVHIYIKLINSIYIMDEEVKKRFDAQDELLKKIYTSVEKTRKYFMWTLIITVVVFLLPLLGLLFIIPQFLSIYSTELMGF